MFNPFTWALSLIFGKRAPDTRKEYRVRCPRCFSVNAEKFHPPLTEDDKIRTIDCDRCGYETRIVLPVAPEECPDESASS